MWCPLRLGFFLLATQLAPPQITSWVLSPKWMRGVPVTPDLPNLDFHQRLNRHRVRGNAGEEKARSHPCLSFSRRRPIWSHPIQCLPGRYRATSLNRPTQKCIFDTLDCCNHQTQAFWVNQEKLLGSTPRTNSVVCQQFYLSISKFSSSKFFGIVGLNPTSSCGSMAWSCLFDRVPS